MIPRWLLVFFPLLGCGSPIAPDAGSDAFPCTIDRLDAAAAVESELSLRGRRLSRDVLGLGGVFEGDFNVVDVRDGTIIVGGNTSGDSFETTPYLYTSWMSRHYVDGRIELVGTGPAGASAIAVGGGDVLQVANDPHLWGPAAQDRRYHITLWGLGDVRPVATAEPLPFDDTLCNAPQQYGATMSEGRYLLLRTPCILGGPYLVAERWARDGDRLARVRGPFEVLEPQDAQGATPRVTTADGRGGVFWIANGPEVSSDRSDRTLVVQHWDGDTAPIVSAPLGPVGTTTDFALGFMHSSGDYIALGNHVVDGFSRTYVARVRDDGSFAWTWESPRGYVSGPNWPGGAVVGDDDILVLLYQPASRDTISVVRLSAMGEPSTPEPRVLMGGISPGGFTVVDGGFVAASHADGSFHILWAEYNNLHLQLFGPDLEPQWASDVVSGAVNLFEAQLFDDRAGGVWAVWNDPRGAGHVQHWDRSGWALYRSWQFPGCDGVYDAAVVRTGPGAPATIYERRR
ncbi:MAG: hypothetical protein U0353_02135 [Sandaracinus sp.]